MSEEDKDDKIVNQVVATDDSTRFAAEIEDIPADEGAQVMEGLPASEASDVAEALDPNTAARILVRMTPESAAHVIEGMEAPEASMVLGAMNPDDRVDILEHVPRGAHDEIVREMDVEQAKETLQLEKYAPDTAGGIMTTQVTALYEYISVDDAVTLLRKLSEELEQMFYVYVIDRRQKLVGVLSMRDLILSKPTSLLRDIMIPNVRSVPVTTDQEQVAQLMRKYGYLAMPVVDEQGRLVGLITVDDVVDVLQDEATEDFQRMFGAGPEERLTSPWWYSFKARVWWLEINLATAFLAGAVVGLFEDIISRMAVLAVYLPIVAGMGGNASAQAMAVAVRGLSTGKVDRKVLRHVIMREFMVGLMTGLIVAVTTGTIALVWQGNPWLGLVVGMALVINHLLACTSGAAIPFIMKKLGFDPAQSATIFATTVTDVAGFFAFLGLAYLFMGKLVS